MDSTILVTSSTNDTSTTLYTIQGGPKNGPFSPIYDDTGRHCIYQNVQYFIRSNSIFNVATFNHYEHKFTETILQ